MANLWYYTSEGKQMKPVSGAELKQLAASGLLRPTDLVWTEGMPKWVRASRAGIVLVLTDGILFSPLMRTK